MYGLDSNQAQSKPNTGCEEIQGADSHARGKEKCGVQEFRAFGFTLETEEPGIARLETE